MHTNTKIYILDEKNEGNVLGKEKIINVLGKRPIKKHTTEKTNEETHWGKDQ